MRIFIALMGLVFTGVACSSDHATPSSSPTAPSGPAVISDFLRDSSAQVKPMRGFSQAAIFCNDRGLRLPTLGELVNEASQYGASFKGPIGQDEFYDSKATDPEVFMSVENKIIYVDELNVVTGQQLDTIKYFRYTCGKFCKDKSSQRNWAYTSSGTFDGVGNEGIYKMSDDGMIAINVGIQGLPGVVGVRCVGAPTLK